MNLNRTILSKHFLFVSLGLFCCVIIIFVIVISNRNSNRFDSNIKKTVEISSFNDDSNKSFGTGWFLNENTIVTNYHVVSFLNNNQRVTFDTIEIRFFDEETYEKVALIKYDSSDDICFLKYIGFHYHGFFKLASSYKVSEPCYSIGNFSNYGLSYKEGYISLTSVNLFYENKYSEFIQCGISIGPGDSGSPLFNKRNQIIGMITFRTKGSTGNVEQMFAFAIPIFVIEEAYRF